MLGTSEGKKSTGMWQGYGGSGFMIQPSVTSCEALGTRCSDVPLSYCCVIIQGRLVELWLYIDTQPICIFFTQCTSTVICLYPMNCSLKSSKKPIQWIGTKRMLFESLRPAGSNCMVLFWRNCTCFVLLRVHEQQSFTSMAESKKSAAHVATELEAKPASLLLPGRETDRFGLTWLMLLSRMALYFLPWRWIILVDFCGCKWMQNVIPACPLLIRCRNKFKNNVRRIKCFQ